MRTFRSLRHRNYRLYFIGQMTSLIGSWMQTTAVMWLAYDMTHQSRWPAFMLVAQIGPTLLFGAWAGSLADRSGKLRLILQTQTAFLVSASLLATVIFLGWATPWLLMALMACHGMIQAIDLPTRLAFVPELVPREDLINTVALNSLQFNVARAIGPAIAGLILVTVGPTTCFLLNALSYIAVIAALRGMRELPANATEPRPHHPSNGGTIAVLRQNPRILFLILLAGAVSVGGWPLLSLLPAFAERVLQAGERGYSLMLSSVGVGALIAALLAATFGSEQRHRTLLVVGVLFVAAALSLLPRVQHTMEALGCCALFGFGMILFLSTGQAAVQLGVDGANRGKVMGVWAMMLAGGTPVGNLVLGPAADVWGVTNVMQIQGIALTFIFVMLVVRFGLYPWSMQRPRSD